LTVQCLTWDQRRSSCTDLHSGGPIRTLRVRRSRRRGRSATLGDGLARARQGCRGMSAGRILCSAYVRADSGDVSAGRACGAPQQCPQIRWVQGRARSRGRMTAVPFQPPAACHGGVGGELSRHRHLGACGSSASVIGLPGFASAVAQDGIGVPRALTGECALAWC